MSVPRTHAGVMDHLETFIPMVLRMSTGDSRFLDDPEFGLKFSKASGGLTKIRNYIFRINNTVGHVELKTGVRLVLDAGVMQQINDTVELWDRFYWRLALGDWKKNPLMMRSESPAQVFNELRQAYLTVVQIQTEAMRLVASL